MTVTNPYYEFDPAFVSGTKARSGDVNSEFLAVQTAFDYLPSTAAAITRGVATIGTESGSGNAFAVAMPDTRTSNQEGDLVTFRATHGNTGASTLDIDGIGAISMRHHDDSELASGDITSGRYYTFRYDSTLSRFIMSADTEASSQVAFAAEWATAAEDTLISVAAGGDGSTDYSALHWAAKAAASALGVGAENVSYRGDHDASMGAPSTPADRSMYRISVAGTFGSISWRAGDYAIYDGTSWDKLLPTGAALSVLGVAGNSAGDYADITAGSDGDVLRRNGTSIGFGSVADSALSSNVPLLDQANVFTQTGATNPAIRITAAAPAVVWDETGAPTDSGRWEIAADGGIWYLRTANDAYTVFSYPLYFIRSGSTVVSSMQLNATLIDINGAIDVSGGAAFSSSVTLTNTAPMLSFIETGVTADNTTWDLQVNSEQFRFRAVNDAYTTAGSIFVVDRTDNTIDSFQLNATSLDFNGSLYLSGSLYVGDNAAAWSRPLTIQAGAAWSGFYSESATTGERGWLLGATSGGAFQLLSRTDADGAGATAISISRSAAAITQIQLNATTLDFNGTLDVDGAAHNISDGTGSIAFDGSGTIDLTGTIRTIGGTYVLSGGAFRVYDSGNVDYGQIAHDGTDLNFTGVNTTDLNIISMGLNAYSASRNVTASDNTTSNDRGMVIRMTAGSGATFTLDSDPPTNAFVILDNSSGNSWTIAASGTLIWALTAGTGNRTLADDGLAVAVHRGSGVWVISGGGLS